AQKIKTAFNDKFYDKSNMTYKSQEKNTIALAFGLAPEQDEIAVAQALKRDVTETHNGHIFTGYIGSRYIHSVLAEYGYDKTLNDMLHKESFPGYGYLFSRGANTFWENWGELKFEDREQHGDARSKNHPYQAGFTAWFYNGIAGINPDPQNPGFKHIILRPQYINTMEWASAKYNSIYGPIISDWENTADEFIWTVSIPVNTTATVYIPGNDKDSVYEGDKLISQSDNIRFLKIEDGNSIFHLESGNYSFKMLK
ncbi:MAG: alpha-L-rhamnosidase C-terminal domain-containing protein, partial [Cyclobacteriaceae bacterium]